MTRTGERIWRVVNFPIEDWFGTAALFVILVTLASEIVLRYVFSNSLFWYDELSRYLLIGMTYLGCATGMRKRGHIRIDLIDRLLPERAASALARAVDLVVLLYLLYVAYQTLGVMAILRRQPSAALGVPIGYVYGTIFVGFTLAAMRLVLEYVGRAGKR
jgi:TRAP-type transport system small permease protein